MSALYREAEVTAWRLLGLTRTHEVKDYEKGFC